MTPAAEAGVSRRARPGGLPGALWALGPRELRFRESAYAAADLPSLWTPAPEAVAWLALWQEDLVLLGPYGDERAFGAIVREAERVACDTGRAALVASVRNDEVERFACLQRLGFVLAELRLGVWADEGAGTGGTVAEGGAWGDIRPRDELVLTKAVVCA